MKYKHCRPILIAFVLIFSVSNISGQIYILVRTDAVGVIKKANVPDGLCLAAAEARAKGGTWERLLASDTEGYGAVFIFSNKAKSPKPQYFLSYGKETSREAIKESRDKAVAAAIAAKGDYWDVFIGQIFNNLNKFPLERPTTAKDDIETKCTPASADQNKRCRELALYRDTELFRDWNRARSKYILSAQQKARIEKLKAELLDETRWAEWQVTTGSVVANLKLTANLIKNLLSFAPPGAAAGAAVTTTRKAAKRIKTAIEAGEKYKSIINEEFGELVLKEFLSQVGPIGKVTETMLDLARDIEEMASLTPNYKKLKQIVREQLAAMDRALDGYEQRMNNSEEQLSLFEEIKVAIDAQCNSK